MADGTLQGNQTRDAHRRFQATIQWSQPTKTPLRPLLTAFVFREILYFRPVMASGAAPDRKAD